MKRTFWRRIWFILLSSTIKTWTG